MNYPNVIGSKLPNVGTTIFTVMSKLAMENKAINLSQGFPDFGCDERLISLINLFKSLSKRDIKVYKHFKDLN